ncbi:DUF6090 family protein [Flavobacteriaceae bacterium S356]|uniref:DUF6090 family protein n=1 Tax=Asprobacillus argus TaxID=3076534 RepID=A0ABU3LHS8_9FLAO|nr:DUF6090 family protein [Flavobacteriaceae bacterium S356]
MKNKTSTYVKYAIGEIALVMVGILLALQVSNWNQGVQKEKLELKLLGKLQEDLTNMYGDIANDLKTMQLGDRSHFRILDYMQKNETYKDSMCFDFHWLAKDEYIYPVTSTYDVIKREGLNIVKNDSIRMGVQLAFENFFSRLVRTNAFYPNIEEFFSPYFQKNFTPNKNEDLIFKEQFYGYTQTFPYKKRVNDKTYTIAIGYVPKDFEKLKKDEEFSMLMQQAYSYRTYKINRYKSAKYVIEELQKLIDKELKNRQ